jgi:8-oxo-dGTP pyrophosphatase MutT (NUDIX family)
VIIARPERFRRASFSDAGTARAGHELCRGRDGVFPAVRVDEADGAYARALAVADDIDEMAARIAAVRETIEECGPGFDRPDGRGRCHDKRCVTGGAAIGHDACGGCGRTRQSASNFMRLIPFARWCPSAQALHKRFDTRFFVAALEEGEQVDDLLPDGSESVRLAWHSAHEVLEEANAERVKIIFPTRRNLERLAQCRSIEELVEHALRHPVSLISPWIERRGGEPHLCIPEGLGYPVTSEPLSTAMRE